MDSSTTQLISLIVSTIGTVAVAWIGFKMKQLEHHMNSVREQLVITTAAKSHAEGKLAGKAEAALTPPAP